MNPSRHTLSAIPSLGADADPDTLDTLVSSSRRLGRFWPPVAAGEEPAGPSGAGFAVSSGAQRLVAGMAEYGV